MLGAAAAADFDVCQDPITPEPHEVRSLQATKERSSPLFNQPQTPLLGVAVPSDPASRLIADVCEGRGSPRWTWQNGSGVPEASAL